MDYTLMLGGCLERMQEIPDGSVDIVLCEGESFRGQKGRGKRQILPHVLKGAGA